MASQAPDDLKVNRFDPKNVNWSTSVIRGLTEKHFYGKLTLHIENGVITRMVKEEGLKP